MSQSHRIMLLLMVMWAGIQLAGCGGSSLPPPRVSDDEEVERPPTQPPKETETARTPDNPRPEANPEESSSSDPIDEPEPRKLTIAELAQQRRQYDLKNLEQIGAALSEFAQENGYFPPHRGPLSWRVYLLPYLGETALYEEFDLGVRASAQPTQRVPEIYRQHRDTIQTTPYLGVYGDGTVFGSKQGATVDEVTDGLQNTIAILVTVGEWVVWSEAEDMYLGFNISPTSLDTYRSDSFLAVLASGHLVEIDRSIPQQTLREACTVAGGEDPAAFHQYVRTASSSGKPSRPLVQLDPRQSNSGSSGSPDPIARGDDRLPSAIDASSDAATSQNSTTDEAGGRKIPTKVEQKDAMALVKELFLDRYQTATTRDDKKVIARELLAKSKELGEDRAGKYVMLTTAKRIALEVDDIETAEKALQQLLDEYDLDAYEMKVSLLKKTATLSQSSTFDTRIMDESWKMALEAVKRDDYETANLMTETALAAARRLNDKDRAARYSRGLFELEKMEASYRKVNAALAQVGDASEDPEISEMVGRYYCFMKDEWSTGLPHLANAADADLRRLAQRDLEAPVEAERQLELADGWWEAARKARSPEDKRIENRALWWYESALKSLPKGLPRLKAELRVKEIQSQQGAS